MIILSGNSNPSLSESVASYIGVPLGSVHIRRFADQEIFIEIQDSVRGEDVFVIQSTSTPAHDNLMELLMIIDALRRGSAKRINAVIPYFGYARQDRKTGPRTPISAKLVANLLQASGAHRILSFELHTSQIQGFFDIPVDNLYGSAFITQDIRTFFPSNTLDNLVIVSPDIGGMQRARAIAKRLSVDVAVIDKRRDKPGVSEVMNVIGTVQERHCIIVDDIVDSAGTLCNAAQALWDKGALTINAYGIHGVLSDQACDRIQAAHINQLIITDTIAQTQKSQNAPKIRQISIAPLMGEAILRISQERSLSELFI